MSSSNPFDNVVNDQFLDSYESDQDFSDNDNPFDTYFKVQDKRKEEVLKQVLSLAQQKDPNRIGKAQILAQEPLSAPRISRYCFSLTSGKAVVK